MPPQAGAPTWTTRTLMAWMTEAFAKAGLDSPRLMSEMLLGHVLGCERLALYTDADRAASERERSRLRDLVQRALRHEPVQYLVGEAWFFSLPFSVDRRVLVPRPSTETIVERAMHHARAGQDGGRPDGAGMVIADVCTGSGAIAIALLRNLPRATAVATDLSAPALEVAAANAQRHGVADRITFAQGDLLAPLRPACPDGGFHMLLSNPPYIPEHEWESVPRNVREHEPEMALRAGPDGLRFVRAIIEGAPALVRTGGLLLVESAASTAAAAGVIADENPEWTSVEVLKDWEGLDRVVKAARR
jgi:release factor glutamine methyltransferase